MIRTVTASGPLLLCLAACSSLPFMTDEQANADATSDQPAIDDMRVSQDMTQDLAIASLPEPFSDAPTSVRKYVGLERELANPERGFYSYIDLTEETDFAHVRERGHTLVYSYIRLDDWRDKDLPQALFDRMDRGLDAVRAQGLKVVLRFAYNFGPYPDSEPDASKARVLGHIAQLKPVIARHADVLAVVQAGFIGAWGEWHTSTNDLLADPADRKEILEALVDALPGDLPTQIRYPAYKREMYGDALTARDDSYAARTGHHNDCFVSSDTDVGTYPPAEIDALKDYLARDTRHVVMGGETCAESPPRSECASAMQELERLHFTFLNRDYHPGVIESWVQGGCDATIRRKLGYRLTLTEASLPDAVRPGGGATVSLTLENKGWAAPFRARPVVLGLRGEDGRARTLTLPLDVRDLGPGVHTWSGRVAWPADLAPGTYTLTLALPDPSERLAARVDYAIKLANEGLRPEGTISHDLGEVRVGADAPGSTSPQNTTWALLPMTQVPR